MKPNEIYALTPISTSNQFSSVASALQSISTNTGKDHILIALLDNVRYEIDEAITEENRFEVRTYMEEGDDKYGANLYAVYFDSKPLMIVHNNGRYYGDYMSYLTNEKLLNEVTDYIISKVPVEETHPGVYDPNEEIEGLEQVGDYNLHDYYVTDLKPQYQKDDLVWAWVPENHLLSGYSQNYKGVVLTQVVITQVYSNKPKETYWGMQPQRGWDQESHTMVLNAKNCNMGCSLNDKTIVGKVSDIPMPDLAINNFVDEKGYLPETYKMEMPTEKGSKPKMK